MVYDFKIVFVVGVLCVIIGSRGVIRVLARAFYGYRGVATEALLLHLALICLGKYGRKISVKIDAATHHVEVIDGSSVASINCGIETLPYTVGSTF